MCIMMARLRPMTFSPTGMPACLRASSRQSNAARSCAKHDPERNVLGCSQTLKNDTLTHPSLWADHSKKEMGYHGKAPSHRWCNGGIAPDVLATELPAG